MYIRNRSGPEIDHCGTPVIICLGGDFIPLISTNCALSVLKIAFEPLMFSIKYSIMFKFI